MTNSVDSSVQIGTVEIHYIIILPTNIGNKKNNPIQIFNSWIITQPMYDDENDDDEGDDDNDMT